MLMPNLPKTELEDMLVSDSFDSETLLLNRSARFGTVCFLAGSKSRCYLGRSRITIESPIAARTNVNLLKEFTCIIQTFKKPHVSRTPYMSSSQLCHQVHNLLAGIDWAQEV
jgi:hypothetical protein